jgi:hypothetical protein
MATPPNILATFLTNLNTSVSTIRAGFMSFRPLYNLTTTLTTRAVAPTGITTGIFGLGLLGYIPATISNIQTLQRLQSFAQTGIRASAGFSMPY